MRRGWMGFVAAGMVGLAQSAAWAADDAPAFAVRGLGGAGGMFVPSVAPYGPNQMLLACDMSGSYRSVDGGKSWALIHFQQMNGNVNAAFPPICRTRCFGAGI